MNRGYIAIEFSIYLSYNGAKDVCAVKKLFKKIDNEVSQKDNVEVNRFFRKECKFVASVANEKSLPDIFMPEIAFCGRSNVGKSSIINALFYQRHLAYTSNTPGKTQMLNFFLLANTMRLVDLPGYGYAKAPKDAVNKWGKLIEDYLNNRENLMKVFLLIDARRGLMDIDHRVIESLDKLDLNYQFVLTKIDKVNEKELNICMNSITSLIDMGYSMNPTIVKTSALKDKGLEVLRYEIRNLVRG